MVTSVQQMFILISLVVMGIIAPVENNRPRAGFSYPDPEKKSGFFLQKGIDCVRSHSYNRVRN